MDSVFGMGAPGVVSAAACIVGAAWLFGAAVHLYLAKLGFGVRGAALAVGMGLAAAALTIQLGYFLVDNVLVVLIPAAAASLVYSGVTVVRAVRGDTTARAALRSLTPSATDWCTSVTATVVLFPLIRLGLVYFTTFVNDFPSYAASTEQWLSKSKLAPDFLDKHPDFFGLGQHQRAEHEKPSATGVLVFARVTSGVPSYSLLGPLTVVSVLVLAGNLAAAIRSVFQSRAITASSAALIAVFSIVPMSRVHDAQLGQALAVAFLAVLLHSVALVARADGRTQSLAASVLVGLLVAVTVGANPTVVLGAAISWGALAVWMAYHLQVPWLATLKRAAAAAAVALVVSWPAIDGYRTSVNAQATGAAGYDVPFPSPLAAVGLQFDLGAVTRTGQTLAAWAFVGAAAVVATLVLSRSRTYLAAFALVATIVINGLIVGGKFGAVNYATHKWIAVVLVVVTPFLLARLVALVPIDRRRMAAGGLATLALASVLVSWRASDDVPSRTPLGLFLLPDSSQLAELDTVNVVLDDTYQNSLAPLVIPADHVVLVGESYSLPAPPVGNRFVLSHAIAGAWGAVEVQPLTAEYVLATVDLAITSAGPVEFGPAHPASGRYLYGRWANADDGVWTTGRTNRVVFDVPPNIVGRDLFVVLSVRPTAESRDAPELIVRVNTVDDPAVASVTFADAVTQDVELIVPAEVVAAAAGRVVLVLSTTGAARNDRHLLLHSVTVAAVA